MRKRFILYKITEIPAGGASISYLKDVKYGKPYFSILKSEARRFSLGKALYFGIRYSLSTLPERLAWERPQITCKKIIAYPFPHVI